MEVRFRLSKSAVLHSRPSLRVLFYVCSCSDPTINPTQPLGVSSNLVKSKL